MDIYVNGYEVFVHFGLFLTEYDKKYLPLDKQYQMAKKRAYYLFHKAKPVKGKKTHFKADIYQPNIDEIRTYLEGAITQYQVYLETYGYNESDLDEIMDYDKYMKMLSFKDERVYLDNAVPCKEGIAPSPAPFQATLFGDGNVQAKLNL